MRGRGRRFVVEEAPIDRRGRHRSRNMRDELACGRAGVEAVLLLCLVSGSEGVCQLLNVDLLRCVGLADAFQLEGRRMA